MYQTSEKNSNELGDADISIIGDGGLLYFKRSILFKKINERSGKVCNAVTSSVESELVASLKL